MIQPPPVFDRAVRHVHLLGAGDRALASLGLYLRQRGFAVSAEDDAWDPASRAVLAWAGVTITPARAIPPASELVVYPPAVAESHPSRLAASARELPQIRRGDMLAEVTRDRRLVAVVGWHGQTVTAAMLVAALRHAGFPCGWVLGALLNDDQTPPARDQGDWVVADFDAGDGTIARLSPEITLAVNLDQDHAARGTTADECENELSALFARTRGAIFVHRGSAMAAQLILRGGYAAPLFTCGGEGDYEGRLAGGDADGLALHLGGRFALPEVRVRTDGAGNALNALAALAVAQHLGATLAPDSLAEFRGLRPLSDGAPAAPELPAEERWNPFIAELRPKLAATTKFTEQEPLAAKTTMRVGGPARAYAEPADEQELQLLLATAHRHGLPVFMLGRGSNLIVPDEGVAGLVISLAHPAWQRFEPQPDGRVWVGAGLRLKNLCGLATRAGLQGFEFMEGIPATVGGALRMNAGAMGGWTFDVVAEVHLLTLAGEKRILRKEEMHVDYRHCAELENAVALGAWLRSGAPGDAAAIKRQIEAYQKKRQESQPREPSAGCIFKNPPGTSAGKVIDECGLKGERVGDAEVSAVHANFIVNRGRATTADIIALVRRIRARVREQRGIDLQPEVMLFGREWRDVL